jgi:hypothetical protein
MPKDKVKVKREALKAVMSGLALMVAAAGMPGQVRLASREQQPPTKSAGKSVGAGAGKRR